MSPRRAFLVVLLLCGLTACDDEPTPEIPDPTPSSSSPAPTESVSPTEATSTPAVALTPEETVRAWVNAENRAIRTGDTSVQRALAASDCVGCANFVEPIEKVFESGGSYVGGEWQLVSTNINEESDQTVKLSAAVRIAAGSLIETDGAEPIDFESASHLLRMELREEGGRWLFTVIAFISP